MLINSSFRDYYDNVMATGAYDADDVRFVRFTKSIPEKEALRQFGHYDILKCPTDIVHPKFTAKPFIVIFCGTVYRGVIADSTYWYDYGLLLTYLWTTYRFNLDKSSYNYYWSWRKLSYKQFFNQKPTDGSLREKCIKDKISILYHQPVHIDTQEKWVLNPRLRDIEFYRVLNPFTAFQELSMWIGGVLIGSENPMITVSDEVKIHKHGFDKWSFRKPPNK